MRQHPPLYKHFSSRLLPAPGALLFLGGLGGSPPGWQARRACGYPLSPAIVPPRLGCCLPCAHMIGLV